MNGSIEISNLRNIRSLRFGVPGTGVWLLTAGNGVGKTSLLACLRRIGYPNAFAVHFPSSLKSEKLDNHSKGSVTYEINGDKVEYAYRGQRWAPRPRKNSDLFDKFGYSSVTYIGATADRITPRPEDFETRQIRVADKDIVDAANRIFETDKFSMLRIINLARGVGNEAFVLAIKGNPQTYHSEKHFSLGELCILKLLRFIKNVNQNSMIIVDELEMALHPRAQVNLLRYLEEKAREKSLTIIFSTHSVTLLKAIARRSIIYLDRQDSGEINPIYECYSTYAIGNIASGEETLPDLMLYVEDVMARDILNAFFEKFSDERFADPTSRPTVKIVPIGGFLQVVDFLGRNQAVLPNHVKQRAVLDGDVKDSLIKMRKKNDYAQLLKFDQLKDKIEFLSFTPEVGLMSFIANNHQLFEQGLRERFTDNQLRIGEIVNRYNPMLEGGALRTAAKVSTNEIINYITHRTGGSTDRSREFLCGVFANSAWDKYRPEFLELFGPMV